MSRVAPCAHAYTVQLLATYVLVVMMLGALYTHYSVGDPLQKCGGAVLALVLLLLKLYLEDELRSVQIKVKTR